MAANVNWHTQYRNEAAGLQSNNDKLVLSSIRIIRSPVPAWTFKVSIAIVMIAQPLVNWLECRRVHLEGAIKLVDDSGHSLAGTDNDTR